MMKSTLGNEVNQTDAETTALGDGHVVGPEILVHRNRDRWLQNKWLQWLLVFVGIFFLTASWSLSTPEFGSPDEWAHAYRAAAVVRGELIAKPDPELGGGSGYLDVPQTYISARVAASCYPFQEDVTADCGVDVQNQGKLVETTSGAARYNPSYYLLVGWPSLISTNTNSLMLMRLVSAAICSAVLASAVLSAVRGRHGRYWLTGLLISMTPMTIFLQGMVNPNGLEIAAAAGVWVALARLVTGTSGETSALLRRFGIAATLLVSSRGLSPLWLAIIGLTCLAIVKGNVLRVLARRVDTWMWTSVALLATVVSVGWTLTVGSNKVPDLTSDKELTTFDAAMKILRYFGLRMGQFVGEFGWGDTPVPGYVALLFAVIFGALLFAGIASASRRVAVVIGALFVVVIFLPIMIEALQYNLLGLFWQSRYTIPIAIGLCILPAYAIGDYLDRRHVANEVDNGAMRRAIVLVVAALAFIHVVSFDTAIVRYSSGYLETLNPFVGPWHPDVGAPAVVALQLVGLVILLSLAWWLFSQKSEPPSAMAETTEPDTDDYSDEPAAPVRR